VETYKVRGCPYFGLDSVGKCLRCCFKSSKAFCFSIPQSTLAEPRNTLNKGRLLSASFIMNLFSAAMQPVSFCTSFLVCGGCIWRIAFILSGLASVPLVETREPSTLPRVTPKNHFSGLSLRLASLILVKVTVRSEMCEAFFLVETMMSST
jgi:hypothetical protein